MITGNMTIGRAVEEKDIDCFHRWRNDPTFSKLTFGFTTLPQCKREIQLWVKGLQDSPHANIQMITTLEGEVVGMGGLTNIDWRNGSCRFGTGIYETRYRGQGLGTDYRKALLRYAFVDLNLRLVNGFFSFDNLASQRSHEKLGASITGELKRAFYYDGQFQNFKTYQYTREDFLAMDQRAKDESHA